MTPIAEINILSPRTLAEKNEGRAIFELLSQHAPSLVPERYDQVEPIKKAFTLDNLDAILEDWASGFTWKRRRPAAAGGIHPATGPRPVHGWLTFRVKHYMREVEEIISFFKECCRYVEADFASLHQMTEGDVERGKANRTFAFLNRQRTIHSLLVTTYMLEKNIPDLYWGTVLGRPYVELFGRERILSSPAAQVEELTDGVFYLQLTDDIRDLETRFDHVEAVRQSIKEHLGRDAFFDEALGLDHTYRVPFFSLNGRNTNEPPQAVDESTSDEELLSEALMPLAMQLLRELGRFDPIAATVHSDRDVHLVSFAAEPDELTQLMQDSFRAEIRDKGLRAVAICVDIKAMENPITQEKTDALQVIYEDATGLAYTFFLPYRRTESGEFEPGKSYSIDREPVLFV